MADGVAITAGSGTTIATDDTGASGHVQLTKLAISTDGSATLVPADTANGLDVDVTRLPSIPAGTNNIGDVDVLTLPSIPAGTNNIGDVDVLTSTTNTNRAASGVTDATDEVVSLAVLGCATAAVQITGTWTGTELFEGTVNASDWFAINAIVPGTGAIVTSTTANGQWLLPCAGYNSIRVRMNPASSGSATITIEASSGGQIVSLGNALPAGTNNIGDVDIASIAAGDNNIGNVDVITLPALPAGTNNIGDVDVLTVPAPLSTTGGGTEATALRVTIANDSTGVVSIDDNAGSLTVDGTVTANLAAGTNNIGDVDVLTLPALPAGTNNIGDVDVLTLPAPLGAAGAASIAKAEDSASADLDVGVPAMAVRKAAPANTSGADGDYEMLQMSAGRLWTSATVDAALPTGDNNIGNVDVLTLPALVAGTANIGDVDVLTLPGVAGDVAHDTADSGNPIKIGARADSTIKANTMVADGDRTDLIADIDGQLLTKNMCPFTDIINERVTDTGGTSTAFTNFSAVVSTRNYVSTIIVYNSSATAGFLDLRDGIAGAVLMTVPLPAGGGAVINLPVPLRQPTVNTALAYDVSAALTTVYISLVGFQSKA